MFFRSKTHQILSNQDKTHMETHFLSNEPIKLSRKQMNQTKAWKKANEMIKTVKEWNEPNKTW